MSFQTIYYFHNICCCAFGVRPKAPPREYLIVRMCFFVSSKYIARCQPFIVGTFKRNTLGFTHTHAPLRPTPARIKSTVSASYSSKGRRRGCQPARPEIALHNERPPCAVSRACLMGRTSTMTPVSSCLRCLIVVFTGLFVDTDNLCTAHSSPSMTRSHLASSCQCQCLC